ncbi:MAG: SDR family oxidoreductase [Deltaproteobacteria bacterium]|nr:SDR family oxidoreductase [Deltaproteobacteria bacterium]
MRTWVVVGANRGIGLELTRHLERRGDRVVAACRQRSPELSALRVEIVEIVEGVDVTSDDGVGKLSDHLGGGAIDALVVVSGVLRPVSLEGLDFGVIREQLEINALGPLRVVSRLIPNLSAGQGAKVALITSRMGSIADNGSGDHYGYRMSKAALNMAGKSLSIDLKGRGVAVCVLHPGFVRTRMTGGHGNVEPEVAAGQLLARVEELTLETTGTFWHADGSVLPW